MTRHMTTSPVVLHVLPSFDLGGLGSLAITMVDAWPYPAQHLAVAPRYQRTDPVLIPELETRGVKCAQVERDFRDPPGYVRRLSTMLRGLVLKHGGPTRVIHYNHVDLAWNMQAIRQVYAGIVVSHIGTVLDHKNADATGPFRSPFTADGVVFMPASHAVNAGVEACLKQSGTQRQIAPVTWNGVDRSRFKPTPRGEAATLRFGFTGRMSLDAKAWDLLFDGIEMVNTTPDVSELAWEFRIAGDGPAKATLEKRGKQIIDRGTPFSRVTFVGALRGPREVPRFLDNIDVFVMAARPIEGMSMALIEAIASGLAIISTDVPSTREILAPGMVADEQGITAGFGMLAKDAAGIARLMTEMIRHPNMVEFMQGVSVGYADQFDAKRMAITYDRFGGEK